MKKIILLTAILIVAAATVFGQTMNKTEQDVLKLNKEFDEAILRSDATVFERILADDYSYTGPDGKTETKMQKINDLKSGRYKFEMVKSDDVRVRVYGDTAIVTAMWTAKGMEDGKPLNLKERYTAVFVMRKGRWQIVSEHGSTIMP